MKFILKTFFMIVIFYIFRHLCFLLDFYKWVFQICYIFLILSTFIFSIPCSYMLHLTLYFVQQKIHHSFDAVNFNYTLLSVVSDFSLKMNVRQNEWVNKKGMWVSLVQWSASHVRCLIVFYALSQIKIRGMEISQFPFSNKLLSDIKAN